MVLRSLKRAVLPAALLVLTLPAVTAEENRAETIARPRDLFNLRGIDESRFNRLIDGRPWHEDEEEILLEILYRVKRDFSWTDIEDWSRGKFPLDLVARDPGAHRGEIFDLSGRVRRVKVLRPTAEAANRLEIDRYFRCEILLDESSQPAVIFTDTVPERWEIDEAIDEPVGALGFFLKLTGSDGERPVPVFAARRIAWYPRTPLGRLGMDVGLLDRALDKPRLTADDRICFYQMLAAVGRAKPGALLAEARAELRRTGEEQFSVVPLFLEPQESQGRLVALSGTARRVTLVRVEEDDILARFGIDHYYELYVFTNDSQQNPLVFCVRELPRGMPTGDGPRFGEQVTVAGFFMKTWAYRIRASGEGAQPGRKWQPAPLLIGRAPIWRPQEAPSEDSFFGLLGGAAFLAILLILWLALWHFGRGDRRFRERMLAGQSDLEFNTLHAKDP